MNILVLSPHTDDAELGCGDTISRLLREGNRVYIAVFSTCEESLPKGFLPGTLKTECIDSLTSLGVSKEDILFYDYQVRVFNYSRQNILDDLVLLKNKVSPSTVFIPSVDD
jgi:LmbE family N-acetylglucosaminyl deacetylase